MELQFISLEKFAFDEKFWIIIFRCVMCILNYLSAFIVPLILQKGHTWLIDSEWSHGYVISQMVNILMVA